MVKYFSRISTWVVIIAAVLGLRTAGRLRADPTDDFSFSLAHANVEGSDDDYRIMPEKRVTEILQDRLDLFPKSQAPRLARHLLSLCKQYRFDPAFVLALIQVESEFRIRVVSPSGAVGLMQVMPATAVVTARELGVALDARVAARFLTDPFTNLTFGVSYLSWLRDHYRGRSAYFLVAAYNVGPARMDELLLRKSFTPVVTKRYFNAIRRGVPGFRYYRREA